MIPHSNSDAECHGSADDFYCCGSQSRIVIIVSLHSKLLGLLQLAHILSRESLRIHGRETVSDA